MHSFFTAEFFAGNRQKLRAAVGSDVPIVVTANGQLQANGDNAFAFRQDSNFWYLTGIDEPDCVLVIGKTSEYLIVPTLSKVKEIFDGSLDGDALRAASGIEQVLEQKEGWLLVRELLAQRKQVATLLSPPAYIAQIGLFTNPARQRLIKKLRSLGSGLELVDVRK